MTRLRVPDGWPAPGEVGAELLDANLVPSAETVLGAELLSVRQWSVVYAVRLGGAEPLDVVVKCIREPHHVRPAQGEDFTIRSELELRSLELAAQHGIPMPRGFGTLHSLGAIVMERVAHRSLMQVKRGAVDLNQALKDAGALCRRWSDISEIPFGADVTPAGQVLDGLRAAVVDLQRDGAWPVNRQRWASIERDVADHCDDTIVATHGDLHLGNVWIAEHGTLLLADAAIVAAHPVADVGRLTASLYAPRRRELPFRRRQAEVRVAAVLAGYGAHDRRMLVLHQLSTVVHHWSALRRSAQSNLRSTTQRRVVDALYARSVRAVVGDGRFGPQARSAQRE